jgi:hypothetical protein
MTTELFEVAAVLDPHTTWLTRHDLRVTDYQDRQNGGWSRHSLNTDRYLCANRAMTRYASGSTADEAEVAYSRRYSVEWWKLAGWQEAMA